MITSAPAWVQLSPAVLNLIVLSSATTASEVPVAHGPRPETALKEEEGGESKDQSRSPRRILQKGLNIIGHVLPKLIDDTKAC